MRIKFGHKAIAPHARKVLVERKKLFNEFFTHELIKFEGKNGTEIEACLVYCHDIINFIYTLAMLRDQCFPALLHKVGMDAGILSKHLKYILLILFFFNMYFKLQQGKGT